MAKATKKARPSQPSAPKPYHTITVRLQRPEHEYLKVLKARDQAREGRIVPYTEILIRGLRKTREAEEAELKTVRGR